MFRRTASLTQPLFLVVLGVFGLLFGSFANVVIWRFPRGESLSHPGSHCPNCGHAVRWWDNIPVASWIVLRARCRDCGEPISIRYPAVELLSCALWVAAGAEFGFSLLTAWAVFFFYILLILAFIDLDLRRLPNALVALLAAAGALGAVVWQVTGVPAAPLVGAAEGWLASPIVAAAAGALAGAGLAGAIALVYALLRGRKGMGMGDVKLLGAMGLFMGLYVLLAFFLGNLLGALAAVAVAAWRRRQPAGPHGPALVFDEDEGSGPSAEPRPANGGSDMRHDPAAIPFGPFLAMAGVLTVLWGPAIWAWYLGLLHLN